MLEAIIEDPLASHSDRLKADEQLRELERADVAHGAVARLSPEQVRAEMESLRATVEGWFAVADGPEAVRAPDDPTELAETLALAVELNDRLEAQLVERERALQRLTVHRRLLPAPGPLA